ncbi:MAG TPA: sugar phosphate nucleotidyltransferase [Aggregatilineaceae bacterium]|nr:sugar phosphate nucleotidyltransferase [Aggregatilineaceae bacterium]
MIQQAVILAAGRGTQLGSLTQERPKSMLPVLGKPMVARVMDRLRDAGIRRFVVVVGADEGGVAAYLSRSWYPDAEVKFALQTIPTGTVDALQLAAPYIEGPFLVSAVDNITSTAHVQNLIQRFEQEPEQVAALSLIPAAPDQIRQASGVVIDNECIVEIEEKPEQPRGSFASILLYAFAPSIFTHLPQVRVSRRGEREISSAIQQAILAGCKVGYAVTDWRLHLTTEQDLLAITKHYLQEGRDAHILSEIPGSVHIIPPVRIDPKVSVGQGAQIGPNVYLETGSTIGSGASIQNCILLNGGTVSAGERRSEEIVSRPVRTRL